MFFITTETDILDYEVTKRLGIAYGVSVYSRTYFGDALASLKSAFGGKQKGYIKMIEKNRDDLGNGKKLFNFALLNAKNFIY